MAHLLNIQNIYNTKNLSRYCHLVHFNLVLLFLRFFKNFIYIFTKIFTHKTIRQTFSTPEN